MYNLQTRIELFPTQEKLLKQEDGSWTCIFYKLQH